MKRGWEEAQSSGPQPVGHDSFGDQTILSQGSSIRYPTHQIFTIHNTSKIAVMK